MSFSDRADPEVRRLFTNTSFIPIEISSAGMRELPVGKNLTETASHFAENLLKNFGADAIEAALRLERYCYKYNSESACDPNLLFESLNDFEFHPAQHILFAVRLNEIFKDNPSLLAKYDKQIAHSIKSKNPQKQILGCLVGSGLDSEEINNAMLSVIESSLNNSSGITNLPAVLSTFALGVCFDSDTRAMVPRVKEGLARIRDKINEQHVLYQPLVNSLGSDGLTSHCPEDFLLERRSNGTRHFEFPLKSVIRDPLSKDKQNDLVPQVGRLFVETFGNEALPAVQCLFKDWKPVLWEGAKEGTTQVFSDSSLPDRERLFAALLQSGDPDTAALINQLKKADADAIGPFVCVAGLWNRPLNQKLELFNIATNPKESDLVRTWATYLFGKSCSMSGLNHILESVDASNTDLYYAVEAAFLAGQFENEPLAAFLQWKKDNSLPWKNWSAVLARGRS